MNWLENYAKEFGFKPIMTDSELKLHYHGINYSCDYCLHSGITNKGSCDYCGSPIK